MHLLVQVRNAEIANLNGLFARLALLVSMFDECIPMSTLSEQGTDIESATQGQKVSASTSFLRCSFRVRKVNRGALYTFLSLSNLE